MKELHQIIQAYQKCISRNQQAALATVVKVDGSAYRRPGARMLVTEDGELTGAISGGCLEGDALRKAQSVIFQQKSMVVTYDTTDEDDQKFGIGLGCNGIIQVLIEPINKDDVHNPIELLKKALEDRQTTFLTTVFSLKSAKSQQIGTIILYKNGQFSGNSSALDPNLFGFIQSELKNHAAQTTKLICNYPEWDDIYVFYECIKPPVQVLLFGAGNDTMPIAKMTDLLGWDLTLIDGRKNQATEVRFPQASRIIVSPADEAVKQISADSNTVALLMTHNFEYEAVILKDLQDLNLPFIGILGPKKKTLKLLERLKHQGLQINESNIYGPLGLDIGAEGSEEIALSAIAEIKAVLSQKSGMHLREKVGPIHEEER